MTDELAAEYERQLCDLFAATLMRAKALDVTAVQTVIPIAEVRLMDAPTAVIYETAVRVARSGLNPGPGEVHANLMKAGLLRGLVRQRMIDATSVPNAHPERLFEVANRLLSAVFRWRLAAAGNALVEAAGEMSEAECWHLLCREGAALKQVWQRIETNSPEAAA